MSLDGVRDAYFQSVAEPAQIEPEAYTVDAAILARPGNAGRQVDLKLDYKRNLERYPLYQAFLRAHRPKLLAVWGRNDPFFIPAGAEAFKRDLPEARVVLLDWSLRAGDARRTDRRGNPPVFPAVRASPRTQRPKLDAHSAASICRGASFTGSTSRNARSAPET